MRTLLAALLSLTLPLTAPGPVKAYGKSQVPTEPAGREAAADTLPTGDAPGLCSAGEISYIFIDNRSIFDLATIEGERFQWIYRAANAIHIETRPSWLRQQLLFDLGDCPSDLLISESGRLLRQFRFLARADVFAVPQPDGTRHIVVDTQDDWTTKFNLRLTLDQGLEVEKASIEEENLLGQGALLRLFYEERRERLNYGVGFAVPNIAGSGNDVELSLGRTRVGNSIDQALIHPYRSEVARFAGRQQFRLRDDLFSYSLGTKEGETHVTIPTDEGYAEVSGAFRLGDPGNQTQIGMGVSWERLLFPNYPESVGMVTDGGFDDPTPADPGTIAEVDDQVNPRTAMRLNVILGQRNVNYVREYGLDNLFGVQDVLVGSDLAFTLGRTIGSVATNGSKPQDDLFGSLDIYAGWTGARWLVTTQFRAEARQVFGDSLGTGAEPQRSGARDLLVESETYTYIRPWGPNRHTFVGRMQFQGGWDMQTPFQLTLGGRYGVRGYSDDAYPGGQRLVVNLEERSAFRWPNSSLFDLGFTVFGDLGAVWASGAPFGVDSGLQASVGAGLRLGFPSGTKSVIRIDLAAPIKSGFQLSDMILRVNMQEILGVLKIFSTPQMERSRRSGVLPVFTGVQR